MSVRWRKALRVCSTEVTPGTAATLPTVIDDIGFEGSLAVTTAVASPTAAAWIRRVEALIESINISVLATKATPMMTAIIVGIRRRRSWIMPGPPGCERSRPGRRLR